MADSALIVAPHPDDESIGCGGTICLHRQRGDQVRVVFLTSGERGIAGVEGEAASRIREAEARAAAKVLSVDRLDFLRLPDSGLAEAMELGAEKFRTVLELHMPTIIYLPHPGESHPDHAAAIDVVRRALTKISGLVEFPELRGYEVWSPMPAYDWVEDISKVIQQKLRAVRCHQSQLHPFRYDRAVRGLNQYRGVMAAGSRYAEAFLYMPPEPA